MDGLERIGVMPTRHRCLFSFSFLLCSFVFVVIRVVVFSRPTVVSYYPYSPNPHHYFVILEFSTGRFLAAAAAYRLRDEPYIAAWRVFESSLRLLATDPRDKVYSLTGLMDIGIEADYSKSPKTIYSEVADIMLNQVPLDEWLDKAGIMNRNRGAGSVLQHG